MRLEPEVATVINNAGTMVLLALLIDRGYRLASRWLEMQHRADVLGPKPMVVRGNRVIQLTNEIKEDA